jgi:uncharacterized protein DUF2563
VRVVYVDLQHLLRGISRTEEAAEHVRAASDVLGSIEPTVGMLGRADGAVNAEAVLSKVHERHLHALSGHHQSLRWISGSSAQTAVAFDTTDHANAGVVLGVWAANERA